MKQCLEEVVNCISCKNTNKNYNIYTCIGWQNRGNSTWSHYSCIPTQLSKKNYLSMNYLTDTTGTPGGHLEKE